MEIVKTCERGRGGAGSFTCGIEIFGNLLPVMVAQFVIVLALG